MNFKLLLLLIGLLFSFAGFSQEMKEGFTYLETGKNKEAATFFLNILAEYPTNKTAKLCYGRAVGLSGSPAMAKKIFTELLSQYSNDFEIKLNYAESLLWNSEFDEAEKFYGQLTQEKSQSFPALLGYANTLSNLKKYEEALIYVNKALQVLRGNKNALQSKKYINLGYARQYLGKRDYKKSIEILNSNLGFFTDDTETLLNLANVYLISEDFENAAKIYQKIGEDPSNKITALNGLALMAHLNANDKEALEISKDALNQLDAEATSDIIKQTRERHVQALIWNRKYKEAETEICAFLKQYPNENWVFSLRATLNIYKSNFKKSIADYNSILQNEVRSFDGNLGKANAQKAMGLFDDAYESAETTLSFYDNQKDATNFIKKLDLQFTPTATLKTIYNFDNGNNKAYNYLIDMVFPTSTKLSFLGSTNYRTTQNNVLSSSAKSSSFSLGVRYQLRPSISFKAIAGVSNTSSDVKDYSKLITSIAFEMKPFKLQNLEIGYNRAIQDFNTALLNRELVQNNFYANYNISSNFNFGWFTQYFYTTQNDDNTRNLLFTSLYYNILNKPILKTGVNYQSITFTNQVPSIYFSPEKFNVVEVFVDLLKDEQSAKIKNFFYGLSGAIGLQYIEDDEAQSTFRVKGNFGYKFSDACLIDLYALHSNIASATAAGFQFSEIGLRFKYAFLRNPVFRK